MKLSYRNIAGVVLLIALSASAAYGQQTFTQTVTSTNRSCNSTCTVLDVADNTNPALITFVTPVVVNGVNPNPNPIGAYWMYQNKWSIYNLNGMAMPLGAKFNVEYYTIPDSNHFVYIVPQLVHSYDVAYIDHAGLNNNPNAQIRVFPTNSTTTGALFNVNDVRIVYNASVSKWVISNVNNTTLISGARYNVMFSSGPTLLPTSMSTATLVPLPTPTPGTAGQQGTTFLPPTTLAAPAVFSPTGSAGGDLNGNYPNPTVIGLQGKPISNDPPAVGQVLRWNGSAWEPANEGGTGGSTYNAGTGLAIQGSTIYANNTAPMWNANQIAGRAVSNTAPAVGQILKWNGTSWEPAAGNAGSASQTTTTAKPSVLSFKQSNIVNMANQIVNTAAITGLNNQVFTLPQNSRVVFHTAIVANYFSNETISANAVSVWLIVEILDASNSVVARSSFDTWIAVNEVQNLNSIGFGILPAGTYHTRVSINRPPGGADVSVFAPGTDNRHPSQGGQMILEIFPD
jgi:hypothetical protein